MIESIDEIAKVLQMAETADIALIGIGSMRMILRSLRQEYGQKKSTKN